MYINNNDRLTKLAYLNSSINNYSSNRKYAPNKKGNIKLRRVVIDTVKYGEVVFESTDECADWIQKILGIETEKENIIKYLKMLARGKVKMIYSEIFYCWIEFLETENKRY